MDVVGSTVPRREAIVDVAASDRRLRAAEVTGERMTLDTPRLMMRPPIESDAEPLHAIHLDPEVVRYVQVGSKPGMTGAWLSIAAICGHWQLRGYGQWTVVEKASNAVIGRVGLWNPAGWRHFGSLKRSDCHSNRRRPPTART